MLAKSGLERMRDSSRTPGIHHLTGLRPIGATENSSAFEMPVSPWLQTSVPGVITGGMLAFLADAPLGTAIMVGLGPLQYMTSSDLALSFIRPATLASGTLAAHATAIHVGRSVGLSEARIVDASGGLIAHGTSRGFVLALPAVPPPDERGPEPPASTPDPHLRRPVAGAPIPHEVWAETSGLDALRMCIDGRLPAPPIYHLTGLHPTAASDGACSFEMPASGWMASPAPMLYGGATALLAESAMTGAVMTLNPPGGSFAPLDLRINYLRPVFPDGAMLSATGLVVHRGRSLVVASAEVRNAEGKVIAIGSSSHMLLPTRAWSEVAGEPAAPEV